MTTDDPAVDGEHHGRAVGQDDRVVVGQPVRLTLTAHAPHVGSILFSMLLILCKRLKITHL